MGEESIRSEEKNGLGYRRLGSISLALGIDPRRLLDLRFIPKYLSDLLAFERAGGTISHLLPTLADFRDQAGTARGHYFHQDLLVASHIQKANPVRHIDVGSRIDGFVAHVAAFRSIEVIDIRPLTNVGHPHIIFLQGDLFSLDESYYEICDSLSCLHALEHFGLGRYGDPIDPDGHLKGFRQLHKILKPNGILYVSFPIGRSAVHFNAHRVFNPTELLVWSAGRFRLIRFDYVDDEGNLHLHQSPDTPKDLNYGCGIYTLQKSP